MVVCVRASATYELESPSYLWLMVEPALRGEAHRVTESSLLTNPTVASESRLDLYGNTVRLFVLPQGRFSFEFNARIEAEPNTCVPPDAVEHSPQDFPNDASIYTLPSRYCQSDLLARMAIDEFGGLQPGGNRVRAIAEWVRTTCRIPIRNN